MSAGGDWTVPEMMRWLGIEPENRLSWALGDLVREAWRRKTGELPRKRLRPKTHAKGSHCFAVYPGSFWDEAEALVSEHAGDVEAEIARQGTLWGDENDMVAADTEHDRRKDDRLTGDRG